MEDDTGMAIYEDRVNRCMTHLKLKEKVICKEKLAVTKGQPIVGNLL